MKKCADCGKPIEHPNHQNVPNPTPAHHVFVVQTSYKTPITALIVCLVASLSLLGCKKPVKVAALPIVPSVYGLYELSQLPTQMATFPCVPTDYWQAVVDDINTANDPDSSANDVDVALDKLRKDEISAQYQAIVCASEQKI